MDNHGFIIRMMAALCQRPQNLTWRVEGDFLTVRTWRRDMPRVMGREAKHIQALRQLHAHLGGSRLFLLEPDEHLTGQTFSGTVPSHLQLCKDLLTVTGNGKARVEHASEDTNHELDIIGADINPQIKTAMNLLIHAIGKCAEPPQSVEVLFDGL